MNKASVPVAKKGDTMTTCKKELIVLWVGIGLIVAMCLFPPWAEYYEGHMGQDGGYNESVRTFRGYRCVFWADVGGSPYGFGGQGYIDTQRLVVQCIVVSLLTVAGIYTLRVKGK